MFAPRDLQDETGQALLWVDFEPENPTDLSPPISAFARAELLRNAPDTLQLLGPRRYLDAGLAAIVQSPPGTWRAHYDEAALLQARMVYESFVHPEAPTKQALGRVASWYARLVPQLQADAGPVIVNSKIGLSLDLPTSWGAVGASEAGGDGPDAVDLEEGDDQDEVEDAPQEDET